MPIYEYQCDNCAYKFEVKQSIKDNPVTTCERCGQSVRRLISSPGIMFKGSGWYVTDYSEKMKPPAGSEKTGGEKDASSSSAAPAGPNTPTPAANTSSSNTAASPAPATPAPSSDK